jgi:glycosyltransferase involved in cell wall biosynthesis
MQKLNILLLDTKQNNSLNHYICLAIEKALSRNPNVATVIKADLTDALSKAIHHKCNLFFAYGGEELIKPICSRLRDVCGKSILWTTEDPYELKVNLSNAYLFDLVFTNDSGSALAYGEKGRQLPLAASKEFHFIPLKKKINDLRYDTFFAGTAWPNRVDLVKDLIKKNIGNNEIKLKLALPTNEHLPKFNLDYPLSQINYRMSPLDFLRFSNISLTTILLPRVFSLSGIANFAETPPPRLFEAAMSGTAQLVDSNLTEIEKYFTAGEDFIFFNTAEDLIKLIRELKGDMKWRNSIALSAQNKALNHHSYDNRVSYILSECNKIKIETRTKVTPKIKKYKPKLLFVAHNSIANHYFGGVEVYLNNIAEELTKKYEVFFYVPDMNKKDSYVLLASDESILRKNNFTNEISEYQLSCPEREAAFAELLVDFEISIVHFHHFINNVISLSKISKALGVTTLYTMHDYYAICHKFTLVSFKGKYCHPDLLKPSDCDVCLGATTNIKPGSQAQRRLHWNDILNGFDGIIFNTVFSYDLVANIFSSVAKHKKIFIAPPPIHDFKVPHSLVKNESNYPLKVAVLGNFLYPKGAEVIVRVINFFNQQNFEIEFHIFGNTDPAYDFLKNKNDYKYVHLYNGYKAPNFPEQIYSCHLSLHLSLWPETYNLGLSEAWKLGLIPIVSDIGALGERVSHGINGIKIPENSEADLIEALLRFNNNPDLVSKMRRNLKRLPISEKKGHLLTLEKIYDSYATVKKFNFSKKQEVSFFPNIKISMPPYWANFSGNIIAQRNEKTPHLSLKDLILLSFKYFKRNGALKTLQRTLREMKAILWA